MGETAMMTCNPVRIVGQFEAHASATNYIPNANWDAYHCHPTGSGLAGTGALLVLFRGMDIPSTDEIKKARAKILEDELERAALDLLEFYKPGHDHIEFTEKLASDPFLDYE